MFRVLVGYGVAAFTILQIIEPIMHGLHLPEWMLTAVAPGYETRTGTVWMKESRAMVYDIALKPLAGRLLVSSDEPVTSTVTPRGGPARTEKVEHRAAEDRSPCRRDERQVHQPRWRRL